MGVAGKSQGLCSVLALFLDSPCTASDGKLGGAWERGWFGAAVYKLQARKCYIESYHQCRKIKEAASLKGKRPNAQLSIDLKFEIS